MTSLNISFDPRSEAMRRIERSYAAKTAKRSIARYAFPASLAAFALALFVVYLLTGRTRIDLVSLLPTLAFFFTYDAVRVFGERRLAVEGDAAPIRNRATTRLQLDDAGVLVDGAKVLWSEIIEVIQVEQGTVLTLSPKQGLPIPDEALPEGLAREALLALISEWRGK